MAKDLTGKRVAILVTDGFEQVEMTEPRQALDDAGAETILVSPKEGPVKGWQMTDWGDEFEVDMLLDEADSEAFDALLIPGGQINPDLLRVQPQAVQFVKDFFDAKKPVGAICHGPWLLAEADVIQGRRMTSYHSIKTDLINAGADWQDEEVVVDEGLVTSRKPGDIKAFCHKLVEEISEGLHRLRRVPAASDKSEQRPNP
ncbi:protease [Alkalilimnicola ehrlichii]|uniref:Protease n=1 Tax=Alkalilimnicola ehrlichii TaxID=351052 RepID=A0A3E0X199_9GAMM|nr:type 1 glutamine amidotransferase domain-containing protein [Alkalilimnicola ehrlichii]RFA30627.1 protease [Alkalilimnicola ehrlichii]RFA38209.1 protease [Alkalilimnicola ehrlichii]